MPHDLSMFKFMIILALWFTIGIAQSGGHAQNVGPNLATATSLIWECPYHRALFSTHMSFGGVRDSFEIMFYSKGNLSPYCKVSCNILGFRDVSSLSPHFNKLWCGYILIVYDIQLG
jgi:hypothetical protein